jgi:hypothetical protein
VGRVATCQISNENHGDHVGQGFWRELHGSSQVGEGPSVMIVHCTKPRPRKFELEQGPQPWARVRGANLRHQDEAVQFSNVTIVGPGGATCPCSFRDDDNKTLRRNLGTKSWDGVCFIIITGTKPWDGICFILTPFYQGLFWPIFEVWAGHCGCNICPKNLKFSVNM